MAVYTVTSKINYPNGIVKGQEFQVTLPQQIGIHSPKGTQAIQRQIQRDTGISISPLQARTGFIIRR